MSRRKKQNHQEEISFWQSSSDLMSAMLLMLLLIILLLLLYLMKKSDFDNWNDNEFETQVTTEWSGEGEETTEEETTQEQEDDDSSGGGGGGGGDGEDEPEEESSEEPESTGEYPEPDDGIKSAVYVKLIDADTGNLIKEEGVPFELYIEKGAKQTLNTYYPTKISYKKFETTE